MTATIGELCAGYGGLGMGVSRVIDAEVAWYSEIDKGALKVLDHRFPGVPNIGDMTVLDWDSVPPVDILCAGYPCQPFSIAGNRKGVNDHRHLWPHVLEAIRHLRPRLTILENVSGHRSLGFDRVLGDLAEDGMHVAWHSIRASDVGAAHRRERVFIAVTADDNCEGLRGLRRVEPLRCDTNGRDRQDGSRAPTEPATLLPTPVADHSRSLPSASTDYQSLPNAVCALLPTPAVNDMGARKTVEEWDEWTGRMKAKHRNGNGHGKSLNVEAQRSADQWGIYTEAVQRWEGLTRCAPEPTEPAVKGGRRLGARFDEWHMGLPDGWVTAVPDITYQESIRLCGNGVVPQQAAAAVSFLLDVLSGEVAA